MPEPKYSEEAVGFWDEEQHTKIKKLRSAIIDSSNNDKSWKRRTDDSFMSRYLHSCDWHIESAFDKIMKIWKLKFDQPEWFASNPPTYYKEILDRNIKFVLDKRDSRTKRRIYVTKLGNIDTSKTTAFDLAHLDDLWFEYMLNEYETQVNGITCIIDMHGYSFKSLKYLTPSSIRIGSQKTELMPLKHIEFHVVNSSIFLNAAVAVIYPVLSRNIKDHVHFHHSDWDSLHKYVDRECLPEEYGGTNESEFNYMKITSNLYAKENHFKDTILQCGFKFKSHSYKSNRGN